MTREEIAPQYTRQERVRLGTKQLLIAGMLMAAGKFWLIPALTPYSQNAPCYNVAGINGVVILWHALFVGLPLFFSLLFAATYGWQGAQTIVHKQYPPPKLKTYRRVRVRRGKLAIAFGIGQLILTALPVALAVWGFQEASALSAQGSVKTINCKLSAPAHAILAPNRSANP
jgi:hypothetical protein